jgi:hypothetical protein
VTNPRAELALPLAELLSEVERLAKRGELALDRAARLKLEYVVLLVNALRDGLPTSAQSLLPDLVDELDALADRYEVLAGPELRRARCLVREVEKLVSAPAAN